MLNKIILVGVAALFVAGCASTTTEQRVSSTETHIVDKETGEVKYICRMEKPVGSNIGRRNCFSVAERERQREQAQDDMEAIRRGPLNTGGN